MRIVHIKAVPADRVYGRPVLGRAPWPQLCGLPDAGGHGLGWAGLCCLRDVGPVVTRLHAASEALPGGPTSLQSGSNWRTLGSPHSSCGGKGRRPWRSHKPRNAGSIPASATNGRFVQRKDGGLTSRSWGFDSLTGHQLDGGRRQTVRRGSVKPVLAGSTPVAHPNFSSSGRRVIGSPPASGAGTWRFESSRPDHCQIV